MTLITLQEAAQARLETIFQEYTPPPGTEKINVYLNDLPQKSSEGEEITPYCRVCLGRGEDASERSSQAVFIVIGVKDTSTDFSGYEVVCGIIERIRLGFLEAPILKDRFELIPPVQWSPPTGEENYPYFYGSVELKFDIPAIEQGYNQYT